MPALKIKIKGFVVRLLLVDLVAYVSLYHGCCMLTNQIAQLEVGNFHKHPRGGYFLPKAMLIHVLFFSGHGTS